MTKEAILATAVLGGMCLLMWALARVAKRRMGVGSGTISMNSLRVVGKRPLDQKASIYVVEIAGGRHILLGAGSEGTVTKLDDISAEEFALMSEEQPVATPIAARLRMAGRPSLKAAPTVAAVTTAPTGEDAINMSESDTTDEAAKFATVGESFTHFLGKAKQARDDKRDRRASGE